MGFDFGAIFAAVDLANATRVERLDEFELFVEDELTQAQAHVVALALLGIGPSLPSRDRFEITITVDGEAASACDDEENSRARIGDLFDLGSNARAEVGFRVISTMPSPFMTWRHLVGTSSRSPSHKCLRRLRPGWTGTSA